MPSFRSVRATTGAGLLSILVFASGHGLGAGPGREESPATSSGIAGGAGLRDDLGYADLAVHEGTPYASFFDGHRVRLVLAVEDGSVDSVQAEINAIGGSIEHVDREVGYLCVKVPLRAWPRVHALPRVVAANIDGSLDTLWTQPKPEPRARQIPGVELKTRRSETDERGTASPARSPTPGSPDAPAFRRSLSQDALALPRLWERHPTFDGRGVGIAIIEPSAANIAFDHPALQHARDLDGRIVPKIADLVIPESPRRVRAEVSFTSRESLAHLPVGFARLPRTGTFRWGRTALASESVWVLWDAAAGDVWIDTNRDLDYQKETVLHDARTSASSFTALPGIGRLQVTLSRDASEVVLHFGDSRHVTMSGSAAAATEPGGIAGTAPAARLVLVEPGEAEADYPEFGISPSGLIEALLAAARHPDVDVISMSMLPLVSWPKVGTDTVAVLAGRIADRYGKAIFKAAGNSHALTSLDQLGDAGFIVGAFLPNTVAQRYFGAPATHDYVPYYSARGPRADGRASPDVIGPVGEPVAAPCGAPAPVRDKQIRFFNLPDCYRLASGTSAATPSIAGLAASLISGRKQQGMQTPAAVLYSALRASARTLPDVSVTAQGAGVPQADLAWRLLSQISDVPRLESRAPVVHGLQSYLATKGQGVGLYEREGWSPGRSGRRSLILRREDGPAVVQYDVRLVGDVSTFDVPRQIEMKKGVDTIVPVKIHPRRSGIHSVRLELRDPAGRSFVPDRQLTIVAADELPGVDARPSSRSFTGTIGVFGARYMAVRVPPGMGALRVSLAAADDVNISIQDPSGLQFSRYERTGLSWSVSDMRVYVVPQPQPGTWIVSAHRSREEFAVAPGEHAYTIDVAAVASTVSWSTANGRNSMHVDVKGPEDVDVAPYVAHTESSVNRTDAASPVIVPFTVESGTTLAQWRVTAAAANGSGVHMYLYDCSTGFCVRRHSGVPAADSHLVTVERPAPGRWAMAVTRGPDTPATQEFTVDFSSAKAGPKGASSSSPALMEHRDRRKFTSHSFPAGCTGADERLSMLLRLEPEPSSTPSAAADAEKRPRTNLIVPALPAVAIPPCRDGGAPSTATLGPYSH
jgi:hypothetical protein